jgi:hypothetical protein
MFSISWGFRIFLLYTGFAFFIILMVWKSFGEPVELVADDYYNKELLYNDQMIKTERVKQLGSDLVWRIVDGNVSIEFPGRADGGVLTFQRPSDQNMDVIVAIGSERPDSMLTVAGSSFRKGMYRLKADWTMAGQAYYSEHVVVIP